MFSEIYRHTARLVSQRATGRLGWLRGAIGAGLGIALAGFLTMATAQVSDPHLPWLVAPLGASAVLAFVVPASPLAQPWAIVGGDLLSAIVGLAAGHLIAEPVFGAAVGVSLAIAVMSLARCLHPPGGACALLCALGASGADAWGVDYLIPIAANVFALVLVAWIYNNLTGHRWPHIQYPVPRQITPIAHPGHYRRADIEEVLQEWDDILDIDIDELDAVFRAVERKAAKRRLAESADQFPPVGVERSA